MSDSAIAIDFGQTLDVEANLTTKLTLNLVVVFDLVTKLCDIVLCKVLSSDVGIDSGLCQNVLGALKTDSVNVGKSDLNALVIRNIYT